MTYSCRQNLHLDILELVSSGVFLGGEAQSTLEAYLLDARTSVRVASYAAAAPDSRPRGAWFKRDRSS